MLLTAPSFRIYHGLDLSSQVLIDGTDVQSYNVNWLRKHVGIVSQEPILFAMTIAENIRLAAGRDDVTDDDIVNAAKMANAHNFIMQWPDVSGLTEISPCWRICLCGQLNIALVLNNIIITYLDCIEILPKVY